MNTSTLKKQSSSVSLGEFDLIMARWLEAVTHLHSYYHQLTTCIAQLGIEPEWTTDNLVYRGQCPMSQLIKLTCSMQTELTQLAQDMDQVDHPQTPTRKSLCDKLVNHTLRFNQLNDQAQLSLYLVKRSAS